jgi:hypothetical protein
MEHLNIPLPEDEAPHAPANRAVKPTNPAAWFAMAEVSFRLRKIANEEFRFYIILHALQGVAVVFIANLVEAVPYTELRRRRLLAAHQLTKIQREEKLHQLPPLANQMLRRRIMHLQLLVPQQAAQGATNPALQKQKMADTQALGTRAVFFAAHNNKRRRFSPHPPPLCPSFSPSPMPLSVPQCLHLSTSPPVSPSDPAIYCPRYPSLLSLVAPSLNPPPLASYLKPTLPLPPAHPFNVPITPPSIAPLLKGTVA